MCQATGIAFDLTTNRGWNTPSLDQTQAGAGYTLENTRVVLFGLNAACGTWGENRVIEMSRAIMARRRERSNEFQKRLTENLKRKTAELGSTLYKLTWKEWVTPSGQSRSRLRASARRISETGRTGWPTPATTDYKGGYLGGRMRDGEWSTDRLDVTAQLCGPASSVVTASMLKNSDGTGAQTVKVAGWPTPNTMNVKGAYQDVDLIQGRKEAGRQQNLQDIVQLSGWGTPQAMDAMGYRSYEAMVAQAQNGKRTGRTFPGNLREQVSPMMQIAYQDAMARARGDLRASHQFKQEAARLTVTGQMLTGSGAEMEGGGQLNPEHPRWLMGCPEAWAQCHPNYADWQSWQDFLANHLSAPSSTECSSLKATATP